MSYPTLESRQSAAAARAGYHVPLNHFMDSPARATAHLFEHERRQIAEADPGATRLIPLDLGPSMGLPFAATTPNMLASYLVLRAGESLTTRFNALGSIFYVLSGSGHSRVDDEAIPWQAGDVMVLPADGTLAHHAHDQLSRLLVVTDAPLWCYLGLQSLTALASRRKPVLYPAQQIADQMSSLAQSSRPDAVGRAVIFNRAGDASGHLTTPLFIANINTLLPGADQRTHRHNGAAITLCIQGNGCHSVVDGETVAWQHEGVMVTPAGQAHSHHNRGSETMVSLVVQDSGLFEHAGVPGFSFDPQADSKAGK